MGISFSSQHISTAYYGQISTILGSKLKQ